MNRRHQPCCYTGGAPEQLTFDIHGQDRIVVKYNLKSWLKRLAKLTCLGPRKTQEIPHRSGLATLYDARSGHASGKLHLHEVVPTPADIVPTSSLLCGVAAEL